ncbi:MAG: hypothetical protein HUU60_06675 [Armatimonadetes bacterium]|nr:hypothetical protein [Armatimonadota bacterium]
MGRKLICLTMAALLCATGVARAQDTFFGDLRVRAGAFFPSDSTLTNLNKTWFGVGVAYVMPSIPLLGAMQTELAVDVFTHSAGGSRGTVTPITINIVYSEPTSVVPTRLMVGAGAYVIDAVGASKTIFGGRVGLNFGFAGEWTLDVNYDFTEKLTQVTTGGTVQFRGSGLSVMLGRRF